MPILGTMSTVYGPGGLFFLSQPAVCFVMALVGFPVFSLSLVCKQNLYQHAPVWQETYSETTSLSRIHFCPLKGSVRWEGIIKTFALINLITVSITDRPPVHIPSP